MEIRLYESWTKIMRQTISKYKIPTKDVFKMLETPPEVVCRVLAIALKLPGILPIIFMKIIIEDPFPSCSFVISSANHTDNIEPVVSEAIILSASPKLQLNTIGLTSVNAAAVLKIMAQPKVK